ncbi:MAG: hypothetical protein ACK52W_00320 [Alphaproteobacteria bacterium]
MDNKNRYCVKEGSCSTGTKSCCMKWLLGAVVLFFYLSGYDFLVHGNLLLQQYMDTASLWRPMEEVQELMQWDLIGTAALGLLVACAYKCWRCKITCGKIGSAQCPFLKSAKAGFWFGLIIGIISAKSYVWLPIPAELALSWLAAEIVKWTLAGIVLAAVYQLCCGKCQKTEGTPSA